MDQESGNILIVIDTPYIKNEGEKLKYQTFPLGIIIGLNIIITVSLKNNIVIEAFSKNNVKTFSTHHKSRFVLQILYRNSTIYLQYLKQIDKKSDIMENKLHKSVKNKELLELMELEKSLVYFSTSLRSNQIVLEKLLRYDFIQKYPEDTELLEDTIVENKQAIEMARIYSDILSGTMDAFASIVSNNLNIVMKYLAAVTIIMAIPTMVYSFLGMNVKFPFDPNNPLIFYYVTIGSFILCIIAVIIMKKKNML